IRLPNPCAVGLVVLLAVGAFGADHKILYNFAGGSDGAFPNAPLIFDSSGNLYGATNSGGNDGCDSSLSAGCVTIFALMPKAKDSRSEKVLYVFNEATDGGNAGIGEIMEAAGDLSGPAQDSGPSS